MRTLFRKKSHKKITGRPDSSASSIQKTKSLSSSSPSPPLKNLEDDVVESYTLETSKTIDEMQDDFQNPSNSQDLSSQDSNGVKLSTIEFDEQQREESTTSASNMNDAELLASKSNEKAYSAADADKAQSNALMEETYTMTLRQLRQERQVWRRDILELEHLRKLVAKDNPVSTATQMQKLLEEKVDHEEQLEASHEEIMSLKEQLHAMQTAQLDLQKALKQATQRPSPPLDRQAHSAAKIDPQKSFEYKRIQDLEDQIHKWEVLYFESAEMGAREIERLEEELEQAKELLEKSDSSVKPGEINGGNQNGDATEGFFDDPEKGATPSSHPSTTDDYQNELEKARRRISDLEKQLKITVGLSDKENKSDSSWSNDHNEKDSVSMASSSSTNEDLDQYIAELEQKLEAREMELEDLKQKFEETQSEPQSNDAELVGASRSAEDCNSKEHDNAGMVSTSDKSRERIQELEVECEELRQKAQRYFKDLEEAGRKLEILRRENSNLRHVKDSLAGIDRGMGTLIDSLQPLQRELAKEKDRASDLSKEAAALKQDLNREMVRRVSAEQEAKKRRAECARARKSLDKLYIRLKEEETATASAKEEMSHIIESLDYYKRNQEVLQEALSAANEELRKSLSQGTGESSLSNDGFKIEMRLRKSITLLQERIEYLESEKHSLELEARIAHQERDEIEAQLQKALARCSSD